LFCLFWFLFLTVLSVVDLLAAGDEV